MEHDALVDAAEREAAAIVAAMREGPLGAGVPSCPGWTLADLANHLGEFTTWTHVLCEGTGRPKPPFPDRPDGDAVVDWFEDLAALLVSELRATPPDTDVWTWVRSDKSAAFVARRAANELAIHRVDAQLARGMPDPIDAAHAAEIIDETFVMRNDSERPEPHVGSGQTIHLHGSDRENDEWMITLGPDGISVTREHAKGDLAMRGTVSHLALLLYGRPTLEEVVRVGDESVLDVWYREFTF
jgi:uncharacterized protein (TIGR03083 family)